MDSHQHIEGLLVLPTDDAVLGDQDPREESMVHLLAELRTSAEVGLVAILGPRSGLLDDSLDLSQACLGLGQGALCGLHLGRDSFLLDLEEVQRHGSGVVGMEQLGAFVVKGAEPLSLTRLLFTSVGLALGQLVDHRGGGLSESFGGELHQPVVILDLFFHQSQGSVGEHAGGALLMTPDAEVVHVVLAGLGPAEAPRVP